MLKSLPTALLVLLAAPLARAGLDTTELDPSVKPQDDFYKYVNQRWEQANPIPSDRSAWGVDSVIMDDISRELDGVCRAAAAKDAAGSPVEREVGDFYASGMDQAAIDKAGLSPLRPEFDRIDAIANPHELAAELGHLQALGIGAGFSFGSGPDLKNSDLDIAQVSQGGLGLPDRDYYFRDDEKSAAVRAQYVAHVTRMMRLLGDDPETSAMEATAVMRLETALAHASYTEVRLRDSYASYHKMTLPDLTAKLAPAINWTRLLQASGAPAFKELNVAEPEFFQALNAQVAETPLSDWKAYLRWQLLEATASSLSQPFEQEHFAFYQGILEGVKAPLPRWKRVIASEDATMGEAMGQLYVARYFPPDYRERAKALVEDLRAAFRQRLLHNAWMDDATKAKALDKLSQLHVKVGYPDTFRDYSSAQVDRGPYVLNVLRLMAFEARRELNKIDRPVDRSEWEMTPQTDNAYYEPTNNEIVFPAGALHAPHFDPKADDALNYGDIGATMGHEMTHGFDDDGRQYDPKGNLANWWTQASTDAFQTRTRKIIEQFSGYAIDPTLHVNGELTEGENIADLGGLLIAYDALERHLAGQPKAPIDGFTPEQRFFLSYARSWRIEQRAESVRTQVLTDPHAPGNLRCNGSLGNVEAFLKAFQVPEGSPMSRPEAERVEIW